MSRVSKKCNFIIKRIKYISGLDGDYVYNKLLLLDYVTRNIVDDINTYVDENPLNGVGENVKNFLEHF